MTRFGLGRRPSEPLPADPIGWLLGQLRESDAPRIDPPATADATAIARLRADKVKPLNEISTMSTGAGGGTN